VDKFLLEVKNVSKSFPGVKALDDVTIHVRHSEIHAFIGENGAGKSTLMKILNGVYTKDSGDIYIDGEKAEIHSPNDARRYGISIIYQEQNVIPELSVAESIYVGRMPKKGLFIDWKKANRDAKALLDTIGFDMDPRRLVGTLSVAELQMLEIVKAISYEGTKIVLMDEPSASLTTRECKTLFQVVRNLKANGISVIYISHKLEEIFEICEWVTVLRDGKIVSSDPIEDLNINIITSRMIGREVTQQFPSRPKDVRRDEELLRVEGLCSAGKFEDISFCVHRGEVLGIAGLVGAGRTEIARAIFGVDYMDSGSILMHGKKIKINNPTEAIRSGICYLSEDRKTEGLCLNSSVMWNITAANFASILNRGFLDSKKEKSVARKYIDQLRIKTPSQQQLAGNLSGGNQQKIVVGKWLNTEVDVFIFDEPTRGIDVGAKYEIYLLINELVAQGKGVILISSELPEVLGMSDSMLVIRRGRVSAHLSGEEMSAQSFIDNAI